MNFTRQIWFCKKSANTLMINRHLMARCTETIRIHEKLRQLPRLFPHCIHLLGPVLGTQCPPFPSCSLNHPIHSTFEFSLAENRRECRANLKRESVNVEFERNGEIGDLVIPLGRLVDLPGPNAPKDGCLPLSFLRLIAEGTSSSWKPWIFHPQRSLSSCFVCPLNKLRILEIIPYFVEVVKCILIDRIMKS